MRSLIVIFPVFFLLYSTKSAFSYPEMNRHGYPNCAACHVSPSGGGLLTAYGRQLSQEVMSTWGTSEREPSFAYGLFTLPEWLNLGGDFRAAQIYLNSPAREYARFIPMQADLEGGVTYDKWQLVGTFGLQERSSYNFAGGRFTSRRHYLLYRPIDELTLRAGRFQPAFGINIDNHTAVTRRNLRWEEGAETYNFEAAWAAETFDAFATVVVGRPESPQLKRETGVALRSSLNIGERYKAGLSYFYGSNPDGKRHVFGPYAHLGFTPHFFALAEVDFQNFRPTAGNGQWGIVNYLRVNYEFLKGLHAFATQELAKTNFNDDRTVINAYGLGLQWFPRSHFEIQALWQKRRQLASSLAYYDFAWLQLHFYP